jgi:hypothetical protein
MMKLNLHAGCGLTKSLIGLFRGHATVSPSHHTQQAQIKALPDLIRFNLGFQILQGLLLRKLKDTMDLGTSHLLACATFVLFRP